MFGKAGGNITFYYDSDKLFNEVSLMSAYMTKNLMADGGSIMDEFCITDDERDVYNACVKQTLPNIYETMIKITHGIVNAFKVDFVLEFKEINGLEREPGTYIELSVQDNESYNDNILRLIDATLLNCLKSGILAEFYSTCIHVDLYKVAQDKYATSLYQLKQRLFQLKKKAIFSQLS